jgi:serine/threonine protein kinase
VNPEYSKIGKYEILSIVGTGGQGRVFKARDPHVNRDVAIKVLNSEHDPVLQARFRAEAKIAGGLSHPNIVTVHDFGEHEGCPYLVMEFLTGSDLAHIITNGPVLPILDKLRILIDACLGLQYAHEKGIIHRDVKPANIMRLEDGSVKVTDFGVAQLTQDQTHRHTIAGFVIGSTPWMAPERIAGLDADVQTDIWSLGVTAFEFITGVHPFRSKDRGYTEQRISLSSQDNIPKLWRYSPDAPPELVEIIGRCLQRDRSLRYETVDDLAQDLRPLLEKERRARSAILLRQVEREYSLDHTDLALKLVREAIEYDPQSLKAREWRARIQQENTLRAQRQRVQDLLGRAESASSAEQFDEAAEHIRDALQIQPDSVTLQMRLKEMDAAIENQQVRRLVARAKEQFQCYDLDGARLSLTRASAINADDSGIVELLSEIEAEEQRIEQSRAAQSALIESENLLETGKFSEAVACAESALAGLPDSSHLTRLRADLDRVLAAARRHVEASAAINLLRTFVEEERIEEATAALNSLGESWSAWPEAVALRVQLHALQQARNRKLSIEQSLETAKSAASQGDYSAAVGVLEAALEVHGHDPAIEGPLLEFRDKHRLITTEELRTKAFNSTLANSTALEVAGKFEEAAALIEKTLATWGPDAKLSARLERLQLIVDKARLRSQREARIAQGCREAERKSIGDLDGAISAVLALVAEVGTDPRLRELLVSLQSKKEDAEAHRSRVAVAQAALDMAGQCLARGVPQEATEILDNAAPAGTGLESRFEEFRHAIRLEIARTRRLTSVREVMSRAEELSIDGNMEEAIRLLEDAIGRLGPSAELDARLHQIRLDFARTEAARRRQDGLRLARLRAAELEESGDYAAALAEAENAIANFGTDEELDRLALHLREVILRRDQERKRALTIRQTRESVARLASAGELERALVEIRRALAAYPDSSELSEIQSSLQAQIQVEEIRRQRRRRIEEAIRDAESLAKAQKWSEAVACAEQALAEVNGGPELESLLARLLEGSSAAARAAGLRSLDSDLRRSLQPEEFIARFKEAYESLGKTPELMQREITALQVIVARLLKEKRPLDAVRVLEESAGRHSGDPRHQDLTRKAQAAASAFASEIIAVPKPPSPPRDLEPLKLIAGLVLAALVIAAWLHFSNAGPIRLRAEQLRNATAGQSYSAELHTENGSKPFTWAIATGELPTGIRLDPATGRLSGTAVAPGLYTFRVSVKDRQDTSSEESFSIHVATSQTAPTPSEKTASPAVELATKPKISTQPASPQEQKGASSIEVPTRTQQARANGKDAPLTPPASSTAVSPPETTQPPATNACKSQESFQRRAGDIPEFGHLEWGGGSLVPGEVLAVCGMRATKGTLVKSLYAHWPVTLDLESPPPDVAIGLHPGPDNDWIGFTVVNRSKVEVKSLKFIWRRNSR